jgi:hypothetical protein
MYDGYDLYPDSSGYGAYLGEFGSAVALSPEARAAMFAAPGSGVLRKGAKGGMVERLQKQLNFLGYNVGTVDRDFGKNTRTQVKKFQRAKSLSVDGVVGKDTWEALSAAVKSKQLTLDMLTRDPPGSKLPPGMAERLHRNPGRNRPATAEEKVVVDIQRSDQVLTPLGAPPPPAMTAEQRKQALAEVPIWNRADEVDYAVMATSGLLTGMLTGSLGRRIDVPWYLGALGGLGLGAGLGLAASVKLRSDRK